MYAITENDNIILGPVNWNHRFFNSVIEDDTGVVVNITPDTKNNLPFEFENIKIRPVQIINEELRNPKIQKLNGPFWTFYPDRAEAKWIVIDKPIELVKYELSNSITNERYNKETAGFKTTIQGQEVFIDTSRGNRDIFFQKLLMMEDTDTVNWKFPETWLTLTKSDLGTIVQLGANHIQSCFDWEVQKLTEINNCTTLEELDQIDLEI